MGAVQWILLGMLIFCAIFDIKTMEVPTLAVIGGFVGIIFWVVFHWQGDLGSRLMGMVLGIGIVVLSGVTKNRIGLGDGIILCVTGFALGFWKNIMLLFYGLLAAAFTCIVLLALGKVNRKSEIPFVPFLLAGYLGVLFF